MWMGDSLTVIEWLGGAMIASVIGAITAPTETRANILWGFVAFFALLLFGWIVAPTATGIFASIRPFIVGLVKSNAIATVFIVGVVGLMIGRRRPEKKSKDIAALVGTKPALPPFAAKPQDSRWTPNVPYHEALDYFLKNGADMKGYFTVKDVCEKLNSALEDAKVTAWGKEHPTDANHVQIKPNFWQAADVTLKTDYAFSRILSVAAYDVHLSKEQMEVVWPIRNALDA